MLIQYRITSCRLENIPYGILNINVKQVPYVKNYIRATKVAGI